MTEKEKMLAGQPYKAFGKALFQERQHAKNLIFEFNNLAPSKIRERNEILKKLLGKTGKNYFIEPPFHCDYGYNIEIGENFYSNYNFTVLDCAKVSIGRNVLVGPNVCITTAGHPVHQKPRSEGWEYAFPVNVGDNVWIGAGVIINPGITIGENSVIGSGSVVTKDIPANCVAVGNPCKVLREITGEDQKFYFKNLEF